jgi:hypothetical protein
MPLARATPKNARSLHILYIVLPAQLNSILIRAANFNSPLSARFFSAELNAHSPGRTADVNLHEP